MGKTELCKALAEFLFDTTDAMVRAWGQVLPFAMHSFEGKRQGLTLHVRPLFQFGGLEPMRLPCMKAKAFDRKFDSGEDITGHLDLERASRPRLEQKRVNVDFPGWMIDGLDKEAKRLGVTRQSIIKVWLSERLERKAPDHPLRGAR